jgi:YHS domain-containing protein
MFQSHRFASILACLVLLGALAGCGSRVSQEQPKGTMPAENHAGHSEAAVTDASAGLAELSAEDRAAAEKQRVCPVTGDALGEQGKPYKVSVQGKDVFLCCPACEKELKAHPDKYLAKLQPDKSK